MHDWEQTNVQLAGRASGTQSKGIGAPDQSSACDLSACRARARSQPVVHTPNAEVGDRFILARTSNSRRSISARPRGPQRSTEGLDLAASHFLIGNDFIECLVELGNDGKCHAGKAKNAVPRGNIIIRNDAGLHDSWHVWHRRKSFSTSAASFPRVIPARSTLTVLRCQTPTPCEHRTVKFQTVEQFLMG
jgi:hypothetical protein